MCISSGLSISQEPETLNPSCTFGWVDWSLAFGVREGCFRPPFAQTPVWKIHSRQRAGVSVDEFTTTLNGERQAGVQLSFLIFVLRLGFSKQEICLRKTEAETGVSNDV